MPGKYYPVSNMRYHKFDKLRSLVKIFLFSDVVQCVIAICRGIGFRGIRREIQDTRQCHGCDVEWNDPDGENLRHVNVKLEVFLVES